MKREAYILTNWQMMPEAGQITEGVNIVKEECSGREYPSGIKWTRQRKDVYEVLNQASEPLSAVQIYSRIEKSAGGGNYAVSTIYRILSAFEERGLVTSTTWMGDGTVVYELNRGDHTHYAVCLECHKRVALPDCPFAHIQPEPETGDFLVTGHKLELYGYCRDCRQNHVPK